MEIQKVQVLTLRMESYIIREASSGKYTARDIMQNLELDVKLRTTYTSKGKFAFTTETNGEHVIYISAIHKDSEWYSNEQLKVHLDILVGDHAIDYEQVVNSDNLNDIELRIRQLTDQADQITRELAYQRHRESIFREISESTNVRVLWWAAAQFLLLIIIGFWQIRHLKVFFEAKKLV
ncbi:Transmembrane emp24 domain-containing protein 9 [Intoshia linei]|uniref:Transmembrane emp24 domain-containing protein 9 n=1 Tax=Intoshia linei TaxID=1819745 RepID=A0A177ASB7_9BILA|nr:Transmembrane emp24 domain-containing protein 9 [Intoshia linei]